MFLSAFYSFHLCILASFSYEQFDMLKMFESQHEYHFWYTVKHLKLKVNSAHSPAESWLVPCYVKTYMCFLKMSLYARIVHFYFTVNNVKLDLLHIHVFVLLSKYTCKQIINCLVNCLLFSILSFHGIRLTLAGFFCSLQPCGHIRRQGWHLRSHHVFLCFCHFPIWCRESGVVFDCIDSSALPFSFSKESAIWLHVDALANRMSWEI